MKEYEEYLELINILLDSEDKNLKRLGKQLRNRKSPGNKSPRLNKKLFNLALNSIDEESKNYVLNGMEVSSRIVEEFYKNGWFAYNFGIMQDTGRDSLANYTSEGFKPFFIPRGEDGFYIQTNKPTNAPEEIIRNIEINFFQKYEDDLRDLDLIWREKDQILGGMYTINESENPRLVRLIFNYLGFEEKELNKKDFTK